MRKKILILGSTSLAGHATYLYFKNNLEYETLDVSFDYKLNDGTFLLNNREENKLFNLFETIKPNFIVNCYSVFINRADKEISEAIYINSYLPHFIVEIADKINARLIQLSSDCVFSGTKGKYIENDAKDSMDTYGITKGIGEISKANHLTIRASIVGPELNDEGKELFTWFMKQKGKIDGYTNAIWSGITSFEFAKAIDCVIKSNITGIYHLTNGDKINKYDLLCLFKKFTNKDIEIIPISGSKIDRSYIDTRKEINLLIPDYHTMIENCIKKTKEQNMFYSHYNKYYS